MRRLCILLFLFFSITLFAENKVSITIGGDLVTAKIDLNPTEYITLNEQFLFLLIESDHYNFIFSGYPDGVIQDSGEIYYSDELTLEGKLVLKDGVAVGDYPVNVILGFQTCDKAGICNIPVEISEEIIVKEATSRPLIPYIAILIIFASLLAAIIYRRKKVS